MNNLRHTGIYVSDLGAMEAFYTEVFQMKAVCSARPEENPMLDELFGRENARIRTSKLITPYGVTQGTGDMIELVETVNFRSGSLDGDRQISLAGMNHIAFGVDDIRQTAGEILKHGGTMETEITRMENGSCCAFARDIEGNWLELIQRV